MVKVSCYAYALVIAGTACTTAVDPAPSARLRSLGIERIEIVETDMHLTIAGRTVDGEVLASVALDLGPFYMEEDNRGNVVGRRLTIDLDGVVVNHESEGYYPLNLPTPIAATQLVAYLQDPTVVTTLRRWGVNLEPNPLIAAPPESEEVEYGYVFYYEYCSEFSSYYGELNSGVAGCFTSGWNGCQTYGQQVNVHTGGDEYLEYRCCYDTGNAAVRTCLWPPNSQSSCGATGSQGCKVCWTYPIASGNCATLTAPNNTCVMEFCTY